MENNRQHVLRKAVVVGRGALGVTFGDFMQAKLGDENFCFVCDPSRKERYEKSKLLLNGVERKFRYESDASEFGKADVILFTVKYPGLPAAMELAADFVKEDTIIISALNGIASEDDLAERFGWSHVIRCVAQKMDGVNTGTEVRYSNPGELAFGPERPGDEEKVQALKEFMEYTGTPYSISDDILKNQWSKLMLNCGLNPTSAVFGLHYRDFQEHGEWWDRMIAIMKEVQKVAACEGITLTDDDLQGWLDLIDSLSPDLCPSMAQDVMAGRKTEVELFSGTICRKGEQYGIDVPASREMLERVAEIEAEMVKKN